MFKLKSKTKARLIPFNIVHQNMQGLASKQLEVDLFLHSENIDILCITEHWMKQHQLMFNIDNYQLGSAFARESAIHGGSLILINDAFKFKNRKDITSLSVERTIELSCVELDELIIVCAYRPPSGDFTVSESVMETVLKKISTNNNKKIIVCGDFNINLLESSALSIRLMSLFNSFNLKNLFFEPTRITASSATCLDNIFSNCDPVNKSVITNLTSDHCGQKITVLSTKHNQMKSIKCRPMTEKRNVRFKHNVREKLPHLPVTDGDPEGLYKALFDLIKTEFDLVYTAKNCPRSIKLKFCDWATTGLHRSRAKLYDLYEIKKHNHCAQFVEYVKRYSKIFKKACACAKSLYIKDKIKNSDNKIKATWNFINSETGKTKPQVNENMSLLVNNVHIKSDVEVANTFEEFFTNIPLTITENLNSSRAGAESLLEKHVPKCNIKFQFRHINSDDILKSFKSLKIKNSGDLWDMSVKCVGEIIDTIAPILAVIFNSCVDEGIFPDLMKHSKVVPLFKAGCKQDPSNFRPISILPALSKIFEKIILDQLLYHFSVNHLLHSEQYGFTKGRSTTDAGVALLKHIFDAWEESHDALGIFCDLSKAFDCVEHSILLCKLQHYGVHDSALNMVRSYLSGRIQKVQVNGIQSSGSHVKMGVPQGSILGPFLFLVYINDLPHFVKDLCKIVLFADDTSLVFNIDRNKQNYDDVNETLAKVLNWFTTNNLQLNAKKTKCIKFTLPNVRNNTCDINLNGEKLELVDSTVFLGVTLDSKLQWSPHINTLSGRLSSAAYAVWKVRQMTDEETARLVYFSYFHSIMSYGLLLWGRAADIESIFILQKRAVRSIYNLGSRASLRERFKEIGILTVASQFIYHCILYVHQNIHLFKKRSDTHTFNTRNKNKFSIPLFRLQKVHKSFMGQSVIYYNKIPENVTNMPLHKFKNHIKVTLLKKGYYKVDDYLQDKDVWL